MKATFASYFCSKDPKVLTTFIRNLDCKIEIKGWEFANKKFWCFFNYSDHKEPNKTLLKDLDLDEL